jgi:hypothetical protein
VTTCPNPFIFAGKKIQPAFLFENVGLGDGNAVVNTDRNHTSSVVCLYACFWYIIVLFMLLGLVERPHAL